MAAFKSPAGMALRFRVWAARRRLAEELERAPTPAELVDATGLTPARIKAALRSLDGTDRKDDDDGFVDDLSDPAGLDVCEFIAGNDFVMLDGEGD